MSTSSGSSHKWYPVLNNYLETFPSNYIPILLRGGGEFYKFTDFDFNYRTFNSPQFTITLLCFMHWSLYGWFLWCCVRLLLNAIQFHYDNNIDISTILSNLSSVLSSRWSASCISLHSSLRCCESFDNC